MSLKTYIFAATLSLAPLAAFAEDAKLMIMDPYARSSTPSSKSGAIFLHLKNMGAEDRLIAASSPVGMAQLHTHSEDANGVMKMIHVEEGFAVPAEGDLMLKRGGKHVMLMGLTAPLEDGATIPLTLTFEKAGEMTVDVTVDQKRKPAMGEGHGHKAKEDS